MCIACELGFWMAMEEPPEAAKPKRKAHKAAQKDNDFACDAPMVKAAAKPRRRVVQAKNERRP